MRAGMVREMVTLESFDAGTLSSISPTTFLSISLATSVQLRGELGYAGVAGSMTMIFLTLATIILLRSFYKRWKRMDERRIKDENN